MRLGLWGARMDNTGLGYQTLGFYKHLKPTKTAVIDISSWERTPSRVMKQYPKRYDDSVMFITGLPTDAQMSEFLNDLDVVLIVESAYNLNFYKIAREKGVKTAVQYNYEFFDWILTPAYPRPDMFIAPSRWNYDIINDFCSANQIQHIYIHYPVDRSEIKFRHIDYAKKFVHIAGRPAAHDRNGTYTFLQAISQDENNIIKGIVYTQDKDLIKEIKAEYPSVEVRQTANHAEMYKKGDVLVLPRKYGGNCLPMNEALSAGMPVIMTNLSPQDSLLPQEWLVSATENKDIDFVPRTKILVYECSPHELYLKMAWLHSLSTQDMAEQNKRANIIADSISWDTLRPMYETALESLCHQ